MNGLKRSHSFPWLYRRPLRLPGEERPYRLEGARLVQVGGKTAAYIAYQMQHGPSKPDGDARFGGRRFRRSQSRL